jgi:hypothetical protein
MQRIDMYTFYQLGAALRGLSGLSSPLNFGHAMWPLFQASSALTRLIADPVLNLGYSKPAARELLEAVEKHFPPQSDTQTKPWEEIAARPIQTYEITNIQNLLQTFEHNLAAEFRQMDTYYVLPKGIYATAELIDRAQNLFSLEVRSQLPPAAMIDIAQAGRCIAFELPTAAGFHILRAVESVMIAYMKVVGAEPPKESQRNWELGYLFDQAQGRQG